MPKSVHSLHFVITFLFAVLLGSATFSEENICPGRGDLERGIVLSNQRPAIAQVWIALGDGGTALFSADQTDAISLDTPRIVYQPPLIIRKAKAAFGTAEYRYSTPLAQIDQVVGLGEWSSSFFVRLEDGTKGEGSVELRYLADRDIEIGECTYSTHLVQERLRITGERQRLAQHYYASDLGIIVRSHFLDRLGKLASVVRFDEISVLAPSSPLRAENGL